MTKTDCTETHRWGGGGGGGGGGLVEATLGGGGRAACLAICIKLPIKPDVPSNGLPGKTGCATIIIYTHDPLKIRAGTNFRRSPADNVSPAELSRPVPVARRGELKSSETVLSIALHVHNMYTRTVIRRKPS